MSAPTNPHSDKMGQIVGGVVAILIGGYLIYTFLFKKDVPTGPVSGFGEKKTVVQGLQKHQLSLVTMTIVGAWEEEDVAFNDKQAWTGTAFVRLRTKEHKLVLCTNSHCLGLDSLAKADDATDMISEVTKYKLQVVFPSGKTRTVARIADEAYRLDIGLLEIDEEGLTEGQDFVSPIFSKDVAFDIGDVVVAVGSPRGFAGTHTFGRISAFRDPRPGMNCKTIQHDASINPGNSGGPLFVEKDGRYYWIGVNTAGAGPGLGFAIHASEAQSALFYWADATPDGAAYLINRLYYRKATVPRR